MYKIDLNYKPKSNICDFLNYDISTFKCNGDFYTIYKS